MGLKRITIAAMLIVTLGLLALSACSNQPTKRIQATWIDAQITGDLVSVPVDKIEKDVIIHSRVSTPTDELTFMAYEYNDKVYVRADICPPCLSESFSLVKDTLVCDACATVFSAKTGAGIKGACVRYPKASVPFVLQSGDIVMTGVDIATAFQDTLTPGE